MAKRTKTARPFTSLAILLSLIVGIFVVNTGRMVELDARSSHRDATTSTRALLPSSNFQSLQANIQQKKTDDPHRIHYKPIPARKPGILNDLVKPGDFIYYKDDSRWDAAPVVIESHKLIFFTVPKVGCTVWKQLFRRMMGYADWMSQNYTQLLPHNPHTNGLRYLSDYTPEQASVMMTSPAWTRAMMVRDPKQRFLSAFLDKAVSNNHKHIIERCCPDDSSCVQDAQTLQGFLRLVHVCHDDHWRPQSMRMEYKYWPYLDAVGRVENATEFAKELLVRIGAWDEFGATGWGQDGTSTIFQSKETSGAGKHATWAQWKVWKWYTPELESKVEDFYRGDYENPLFNFTRYECLTCTA